jgi:outer membrane autotransporter protein
MSSCSQPNRGRATLVRLRQFRFGTVLLALLLLFASGQVAAASPTISPVLPPGGFDTIAQNTSILLRIFYGDGSFPVSDGTQIDWSVEAGPSATFSPDSQSTTSNGYAEVTLNVTTVGTYVVQAGYCPDGCYESYQFTINVVPSVEPALAIGSGDGQSTPPNTPFPQRLTVIAGGSPPIIVGDRSGAGGNLQAMAMPGVSISWTVVSGSATLNADTTVTNSDGVAGVRAFAGPTPGPVVVRATRNDPAPSLAPAFVDFHLTVTQPDYKLGDLPGLDKNQQAIADALDELCSGSPSSPSTDSLASTSSSSDDLQQRCQELIDAIATDPDGVIAALDELFGDIALVQSESSLLAAQTQFENIKARIAALRSGTNRTGFGGLALNTASGRLPIGTMFQSLLDGDPAESGGKEVGSDFSRWGFFAAGTIGRGDADAGTLSPSYDFDVNGLTVGVDYRQSDKLIFGGTLGYTRQGNDLKGARGSLDTKGLSVSAYGTWYQQDSWYMDGVLSWGRNSYDLERRVRYTITGPGGTTTIDNTGHADGDGDSLTFALSLGRDFNKGGWGFGPYLRGMYTKMDFDAMREEFDQALPGSGFALELDTRSIESVTTTLGGKLTYAHSTSWGVMIPHVQLEWQHEFMDDPAQVEARFLFDPTGTPFTIQGDRIDSDFFRFGLGMSFVMTKGRSGFLYYERLISRERFSQDSLALGIRLEF